MVKHLACCRRYEEFSRGNIVDDVLMSIDARLDSIQQILSVSGKTVWIVSAQIADKVNEVSSFRPEVNTVVSENSELQSLGEEVANLKCRAQADNALYTQKKFP
ncbi:hypothetical protein AVEN_100155-1 [Araneus ventricosus]|uniref:Uncharacterized protein n=1 Tax=Araneus ventricosus TaxID=182803 RepID=A0A4Y2V6J8_ARAVE|nr:hypothetical protein AVEN_100155-1 [Araneus ventricosus]